MKAFRKIFRFWLLLPCIALGLQGCAALLIGTAGVIGGVAISEDTVQSDIDAGFDQIWNTALNEIEKIGGEVTLTEKFRGVIEAKVRSSSVRMTLERITDKTVRLKVKSRKNYLPNIKLAHELSARILKKL